MRTEQLKYLLHAAVYRKDAQEELKRFASLVRLGLQE
jgi:hypothetical protein